MIDNHWSKLMMWVISSFGRSASEKKTYVERGDHGAIRRRVWKDTSWAERVLHTTWLQWMVQLLYYISLFVGGLLKHLFKRVALPSTVNPVNMKNEAKNVRKNQQKSTTQKKYHEMSCTPPFPLISSQPDTRIATRKSNCNGWSVLRPVYHAKKVVTLPIITHFGGKGFPQLSNIWRAKGLKLTVCFLKLNCLDQQKNNEQTKRALPNCKVIKHGNIHQLLNPNHNSFPSCFCSHPTTSTLLSPKEDRWLWRAAGISDTMLPSPQREWRELRRRLSRKSSNMVSMWVLKKKNVQKFCLDG